MDASDEKLNNLKCLFSQFESAIKDLDVNKITCTSVKNSGIPFSVDPFNKNNAKDTGDSNVLVADFEHGYDMECIDQRQKIQETLANCRGDIVPNHSIGLNWTEDISKNTGPLSTSQFYPNIAVTTTVEDNIVYRRSDLPSYHPDQRQNHQKIQETLNQLPADTTPKFGDHSSGLSRIENIVKDAKMITTSQSQYRHDKDQHQHHQKIQETPDCLRVGTVPKLNHHPIGLSLIENIGGDAETFPISQPSIVTTSIVNVQNFVSGRSESSGFQHDEIGTSSQQENISQETDDFDEDVFKNFVESSDDLDDVDYSFEGQNNLPSIIETLAERRSLPVSQNAAQCEPPAEPLNSLNLSAKRLIGSIDNSKMFVQTSDRKGKKLCCPFCNKLFCKLSRHVETQHKDEPDVLKLAEFPKGEEEFKKERRKQQEAIKTAGLLKWNTDPSINTTGELIVPRRPNTSLNRMPIDFLICPNCTSFHTITNLRNHFTRCSHGVLKGARNIKILARSIEGRSSKDASEQLRRVLPVMREDAIVQLIRYDWLLIAYGNLLCMKYNFHFQQNMIRAKLRLAGRVLHALKNISSDVTDFASIFYPKRYKSLIEAIKVVGKFDSATNEFGSPATSASAITSIKQIGSILKCEYIQKEDSEHVKRTDDFLYLMESEFSAVIRKRVKESQLKKKREKDNRLPSKEDVRLLSVFVKLERDNCLNELSDNFSFKIWKKLSELTIASMIVFNRRRTGESQNILVSDFNHRESINETSNEELFTALSEESKKVAKLYSRMKIRGKKGFNVNVLLQADVIRCVELLLSHRLEAGVPSDNPYLFALPSPPCDDRIKVVNACRVLASLSKMCGAKDPETLRGTMLRKHFATACMAKGLSDDMVSEVAKFMGHAEAVHREHYRINTIDREVVKIVKLLNAAQGIQEEENDDSDSDSDCSDDEDDITILKSSLQAESKKGRSTAKPKIPPKKAKKNKGKVQKPPVTGSSKAGQKRKRAVDENLKKTGRKRIKVEGKEPPKKKLSTASVSSTKCKPQANRKRNTPVENAKGKNKSKTTSV